MGGGNDTKHINDVMNEDVSQKTEIATATEVITKLKLKDQVAYVEDDSYIANPYSILGRVVQVRKRDGKCPERFNSHTDQLEFYYSPIPDVKIDEASKMKKPELRSSIIVDQKVSAGVSFLQFLSTQLDSKSYFSLMVFDQATGLVDVHDPNWDLNVDRWKEKHNELFEDPDICYLFVITGFVQKNIVRKKYIKFEAGAKGGAFGVNVNGELATSTDDYSVDIRFGLSPGILKRPPLIALPNDGKSVFTPTKEEAKLFGSATGSAVAYIK